MWVFISYATQDRNIAEQVHLALTGAGHETFFDRANLPVGRDYHQRIKAAVEQSDVFVFLASSDSTTHGSYALTELRFAREKWRHPEGHVVPVRLREVPWDAIPTYLKAVTVLEPEGSVAAEVVMAVAGLQAKDGTVSYGAGRQTGGMDSVRPASRRKSRNLVPIVIAGIGLIGTLGAALIAKLTPFSWGQNNHPLSAPADNNAWSTPGKWGRTALARGVFGRISEVDDIGTLFVNGSEMLRTPYPNDSGWVDITSAFRTGENELVFEIFNGPYGGWGGRIQIRAGDDSGQNVTLVDERFGRNACPCNGLAFRIYFSIDVQDGTIGKLDRGKAEYL